MWNEGPSINAAQWVMFALAAFAIIIRIGACMRHEYGFWWDDLVMFISLTLFLAQCITGNIAFSWGCGKFSNDVDPNLLPGATLVGIISTDLGMLADSVAKVGVALLIIRLFRLKWWEKCFALTVTLIGVISSILLVIFSFIQCRPAKYQWNRDTMSGTCWNIDVYTDFAIFAGSWTAFLDLIFSLYPLLVISKLQMKRRKKLAVMSTMSFGFCTFAVTTYKVATQYPKFLHAAYDATRVLANIMLWNALGVGFTIIAGSIPTWGWMFRTQVWRNHFDRLTGGNAAESRRASRTTEKNLMLGTSTRPTPVASTRPSRDGPERLIVFPERAHLSDNSTYTGYTSTTMATEQTGTEGCCAPEEEETQQDRRSFGRARPTSMLPQDSLSRLERSTWYG